MNRPAIAGLFIYHSFIILFVSAKIILEDLNKEKLFSGMKFSLYLKVSNLDI